MKLNYVKLIACIVFFFAIVGTIFLLYNVFLNSFFNDSLFNIITILLIISFPFLLLAKSSHSKFLAITAILLLSLLFFVWSFSWVYPEYNHVDDYIQFSNLEENSISIYSILHEVDYYPTKQDIYTQIRVLNKKEDNHFNLRWGSERNITHISYSLFDKNNKIIEIKEDKYVNITLKELEVYYINFLVKSHSYPPKGIVGFEVYSPTPLNYRKEDSLQMILVLHGLSYICDNPCTSTKDEFTTVGYTAKERLANEKDIHLVLSKFENAQEGYHGFSIDTLNNWAIILRQIFFAVFVGLLILLFREGYKFSNKSGTNCDIMYKNKENNPLRDIFKGIGEFWIVIAVAIIIIFAIIIAGIFGAVEKYKELSGLFTLVAIFIAAFIFALKVERENRKDRDEQGRLLRTILKELSEVIKAAEKKDGDPHIGWWLIPEIDYVSYSQKLQPITDENIQKLNELLHKVKDKANLINRYLSILHNSKANHLYQHPNQDFKRTKIAKEFIDKVKETVPNLTEPAKEAKKLLEDKFSEILKT